MTARGVRAARRALVYGLVGSILESIFSSTVASVATRRFVARGPSTAWMVPLYGLAMPCFEIVHDRVRDRPILVRGATYATGALAVEAASGWVLREATGQVPWDYAGRSPLAIAGVTRLDYAPLWALFGLAAERLHDRLVE